MKKSCGCLSLVVLAIAGFIVWCFIQGAQGPTQKYYDRVDSMTQTELDQAYNEMVRTLKPRERADEADQMQLFPGAAHKRTALKYRAATHDISNAWNDLENAVKGFASPSPIPSVSPSPTDSDLAASPTPTPHHKPHQQ